MKTSILIVLCLLGFTACGPVKFSTKVVTADNSNDGTASGSPTPTPTPTVYGTRNVHNDIVVKNPDQKVDILLVLDISSSMSEDNTKLAARLANFVTRLQNTSIDWQMCLTVTYDKIYHADTKTYESDKWGMTWGWSGYTAPSGYQPYVLRAGTANLNTIITNTIQSLGSGWYLSNDERGIKQTYRHFANGNYNTSPNNGCYRSDAALTTILISDEDERSVGGDQSQEQIAGEYLPLEAEDMPSAVTDQVRNLFGASKRFTFNSIIVKPGDTACKAAQDTQGGGTSVSHYGARYAELSNLTGGGIGSICDLDYNGSLNLFFDQVIGSLSSVTLECPPVDGNVSVRVTPAMSQTLIPGIVGNRLNLTPEVPGGSTISLDYKCYVY